MSNTRPKTASLRVNCDVRCLAGIVAYFLKEGKPLPPSRNALGCRAIEGLYDVLLANNLIDPVESTQDAVELLARAGYTKLAGSSLASKVTANQISLEGSDLAPGTSPIDPQAKALTDEVMKMMAKGGKTLKQTKGAGKEISILYLQTRRQEVVIALRSGVFLRG